MNKYRKNLKALFSRQLNNSNILGIIYKVVLQNLNVLCIGNFSTYEPTYYFICWLVTYKSYIQKSFLINFLPKIKHTCILKQNKPSKSLILIIWILNTNKHNYSWYYIFYILFMAHKNVPYWANFSQILCMILVFFWRVLFKIWS